MWGRFFVKTPDYSGRLWRWSSQNDRLPGSVAEEEDRVEEPSTGLAETRSADAGSSCDANVVLIRHWGWRRRPVLEATGATRWIWLRRVPVTAVAAIDHNWKRRHDSGHQKNCRLWSWKKDRPLESMGESAAELELVD